MYIIDEYSLIVEDIMCMPVIIKTEGSPSFNYLPHLTTSLQSSTYWKNIASILWVIGPTIVQLWG